MFSLIFTFIVRHLIQDALGPNEQISLADTGYPVPFPMSWEICPRQAGKLFPGFCERCLFEQGNVLHKI